MNQFPFLFGTPWPLWPILVLGVSAGYFTLRGYARRASELKAPRLKLLKIMRLAAWSLAVVCLLQPMRREFIREEKAARLTVLTDDSESMSFADKRNGPSRLQTVKTALLGADCVAASARSKETQAPDKDALLGVLSRSFKLQLEAFGRGSRTLAQGDLTDAAKARALVDELKAEGDATDITKSLNESFARLKGPDAGGLVLISDGGDTAHGDLDRIASLYKRAGTPVYVLGVGDPDVQDLAISQIRCRRTVSKDTLVRVEVDVVRTGIPEGKHNVVIKRNGKIVGAPVVLDMKESTATAVFEFLPDGQGFLEYEATVEPFPGEAIIANNSMAFGLVAYSRKLRVLYMEGSMYVHATYDSQSPGMYSSNPMQMWWETQFLEFALTEDQDVEVDVLAKTEFTIPRGANPLRVKTVKEGYPKTKKELYDYDVIISSDIPYNFFSEDQIQWTVDFVGKHGGGFAMVGGYDAFAEGKYSKTPIDRMLPVEMMDERHVDKEDFTWRETDEAWSHPIMQVEKDETKNREAWARLPAFHGFSKTTRAKPAATVLAVIDDEEKFGTAYGAAILLAVQPFGNGRSMAFTTDCTGSWGTEWEDSWGPADATDNATRNLYYKTFWKNAIRWLAHYRMQAPNQLVTLESDRLIYGRGEQPDIRIKVMNEDYELTHEAKVQLTVTGPDGKPHQVTAFPRYEENGIYERKLELGAVGRYEIEAVATLGSEEIGRDKAILQVRPATAELRQLSQNVPLLKRLAEQTGGKYLPIEKASDLPKYLREATHVIEKHRDNDLWDSPWIFALITGLFCGEWFLRKRSGLP